MASILPGSDDARAKAVAEWKKKADEYNNAEDPDSLPNIQKRGTEAGKKSEVLQEKAKQIRAEAVSLRQEATDRTNEAHHTHHQANRLDLAHLASEFGLVLCSIALLTKKRGFWFTGIAAAIIAIVVATSAYTIPHESHEPVPTEKSPGH
jgi:hypothetical protein